MQGPLRFLPCGDLAGRGGRVALRGVFQHTDAAVQIADALGCSIDLVVGREDIDAPEPEGIQPRYDALSPEGRNLVDSYLSSVELGERAARSQGRR